MSEPIPESIPTSQDPRSKRPLKRRALSPTSQQASQVEALFAKPDRDILISSNNATTKKSNIPAPPEIVANVQGSSAGAGSGEFHVYKASRRREYERVKMMDEEVARENADVEFSRKREEQKRKDAEKTGKNRRRRDKLRKRKDGQKEGKDTVMSGESGKDGIGVERIPAAQAENNGVVVQDTPATIAENVGVIIHDDD